MADGKFVAVGKWESFISRDHTKIANGAHRGYGSQSPVIKFRRLRTLVRAFETELQAVSDRKMARRTNGFPFLCGH